MTNGWSLKEDTYVHEHLETTVKPLRLQCQYNDTVLEKNYKKMCTKQLNWCQQNQDDIVVKANKLYKFVTQTPEKSRNLTRRCCDFKKLEEVLQKRLEHAEEQSIHSEITQNEETPLADLPRPRRGLKH